MSSIRFEAADILKCAGLNNNEVEERPRLEDINSVREVVMCLRALRMDSTEYACLKAIVLFRAGE